MVKCRSFVCVAAALAAIPLMGLPAWAADCLATSLAGQTTGNPITFNTSAGLATSCSVDGVTFSNMTLTVNNGSIGTNPSLLPIVLGNEAGFQLNYAAGNGATTDFPWSFVA